MKTITTQALQVTFLMFFTLLVAGCSSGGNDGGGGGGGGGGGPTITGTGDVIGHFIDGPVSGLVYINSLTIAANKEHKTGDNGEFKYTPGEVTTFSYGGVEIGEAKVGFVNGKAYITPQSFLIGNENSATLANILRFLQTLDSNNNHDDGISLPNIEGSITNPNINFDQSGKDFESDLNLQAFLAETNTTTTLIGIDEALQNFEEASEVEGIDTDSDEDGVADLYDDLPENSSGDKDGDGELNPDDNCPLIENADQLDTDDDGIGDVCDPDRDGDGDLNGADNCPLLVNADQLDTDGDLIGNACDTDDDNDELSDAEEATLGTNPLLEDTDSDGDRDDADNCPLTANANQTNTDGDSEGNACDADDDNDGLSDTEEGVLGTDPLLVDTDSDGADDFDDNCPIVSNTLQTDTDGDDLGDLCDDDADVPHPVDDLASVFGNSSNNNITVIDNDSFGVDGAGSAAIQITTAPENGSASVNENGTANDPTDDTIVYSPNNDFIGSDSLAYQLTDNSGSTTTASVSITVELQFTSFSANSTSNPKEVTFSWTGNGLTAADHFTLLVNPDGSSGFTEVAGSNAIIDSVTNHEIEIAVHLTDWVNAQYRLEAQASDGSVLSSTELSIVNELSSVDHIGFVKASNTDAGDLFGYKTALSSDGLTLAVSAPREDSASLGVNGSEFDATFIRDSGAIYVFVKQGQQWVKEAYLKSPASDIEDWFGRSVALSGDGNTLVVGADEEGSNATGINGDSGNNSYLNSGAVYVFTRENETWTQPFYLKAGNTGSGDLFGFDVDISSDGNTIVVGAKAEDGASTGVNGVDQVSNTVINSGAGYVFAKEAGSWVQKAYIKASNTGVNDFFGNTVSTCSDGSVIAIAGVSDDSNAVGIGGDQANDDLSNSGAVYIFEKNVGVWSQKSYVKASNSMEDAVFGTSLDLSDDCATLVVGAYGEKSASTGVNGSQLDDGLNFAGSAYIFTRGSSDWEQQAYIKASNTAQADLFGSGVVLSGEGNLLAVSALQESSSATGVNGDQTDNSKSKSGAVYVFSRDQENWNQVSYVKAANTGTTINFGGNTLSSIGGYPVLSNISMDSGGTTFAVGASNEDSSGVGVNGGLTVNGAINSGAVYLY